MRVTAAVLILTVLPFFSSLVGQEPLVAPDSELWGGIYDPPYKVPTEIPVGSDMRKALFGQLCPKIGAMVGGEAILFEGSLKAYRNWAFFTGRTVDKDGNSVPLGELENDDTCARWIRTVDGWRLVDFSGGRGDVFYEVWPDQLGVPGVLLGFE